MKVSKLVYSALFVTLGIVSAFGHPLGNFSVNQFSRIEVSADRLSIRQVLELAEIPALKEINSIDTDKDGQCSIAELDAYVKQITPSYVDGLRLKIDGSGSALESAGAKAELLPGAGGLSTLRIVWDLISPIEANGKARQIAYANDNYADRIGWNEMIVSPSGSISVYDSNLFANGVSDELRAYPQDSLAMPLAERSANFTFSPGTPPAGAALLKARSGNVFEPAPKDRFAALISVPVLTPWVIIAGLFVAIAFGALHAMSPGHGKTVVGAYLVGSRGTPKHAIFLGLTVTVTHTLGVFALGLITLFASRYVLPERLMPFLGFVSGLLVFFIGVTLFKERLLAFFGRKSDPVNHHHEDGSHTHDLEHDHEHDGLTHTHGGSTHSHALPETITWKNLLALGISGGLLPCPSALVLMLSSISLGRIGYGLVLTIAFSVGLAATLTTIGLAFLYIGNIFGRTAIAENRIVKFLPVFSAFVVASLGAVICYSAVG